LEYCNEKIAGNGVTLCSHAEFKVLNASNTIVLTNLKTTTNLAGVARLTQRQVPHA